MTPSRRVQRGRCEPPPLRRPPEALDRRAHPSLDQPLSPARQRLRAPRPKSRSLRPPRHDPPHAARPLDKPLIRNPDFPERLLGTPRNSRKLTWAIAFGETHIAIKQLTSPIKMSRCGSASFAVGEHASYTGVKLL